MTLHNMTLPIQAPHVLDELELVKYSHSYYYSVILNLTLKPLEASIVVQWQIRILL